jgi:hypothetical protein
MSVKTLKATDFAKISAINAFVVARTIIVRFIIFHKFLLFNKKLSEKEKRTLLEHHDKNPVFITLFTREVTLNRYINDLYFPN